MHDATYRERVHALRKAGGGALTLDVIMYSDRAELDRRAAAGDQRCRRLLRTLLEMHEAVAARGRRAPIQCSACPTPLRNTRWAAVVVAPEVSDDPAQALSLAICTTCGPTFKDVQAKVQPVLRKVFPRAYAVAPGAGGRA
jgi:hypothetical protein